MHDSRQRLAQTINMLILIILVGLGNFLSLGSGVENAFQFNSSKSIIFKSLSKFRYFALLYLKTLIIIITISIFLNLKLIFEI